MLLVGMLGQITSVVFLFGTPFVLPQLRADYGLTLTQAGAVVGAPGLGALATMILWGAVADRYGERWTITVSLVLSGIALGLLPFAPGPVGVAVLLALAAACGGSVNATSGRIVLGWFDARRRGLAMGLRQMSQPLGLAVAAAVLPQLADRYGFTAAMLLPAGLCVLVAVLVAVVVVDPPRQAGTGSAAEGGSPYRRAAIWRVHGASALLVVPQFTVSVFALTYLVEGRGWAATTAGLLLSAAQLPGALTRLAAGAWSDRVGARLGPMRVLAGLIAAVSLALGAAAATGSEAVVAVLVVSAIVTVSPNGLAFTAVAELAGLRWAGRALAAQNTVQSMVSMVVPAAVGALITAYGFPIAFAMPALFALAACAVIPVAIERRAAGGGEAADRGEPARKAGRGGDPA
ncbi:sugar phosphate permease [Allonocardiopsis opalescens]|uniref:Sugar phosphate permease n=2 Tax=Allonocardiopsis opalescens TaxID=1144618 RepID=A0A2T0PXH5_9ACTN|nr:sugar phosphate permease [Allonocardiopsis opalescens]